MWHVEMKLQLVDLPSLITIPFLHELAGVYLAARLGRSLSLRCADAERTWPSLRTGVSQQTTNLWFSFMSEAQLSGVCFKALLHLGRVSEPGLRTLHEGQYGLGSKEFMKEDMGGGDGVTYWSGIEPERRSFGVMSSSWEERMLERLDTGLALGEVGDEDGQARQMCSRNAMEGCRVIDANG
ncbi:hypothetical protein LTR17_003016 [Elasticomyces elasticus]|nr:hypothetical protein LTR17_003016 [Elasticomyces elasticus]